MILAAPGARAVDLGTPDYPFALWTQVNESLLVISDLTAPGSGLRERLVDMGPNKFQGKTPADVFGAVRGVRTKLDAWRQRYDLPAAKSYVPRDGVITPIVVFMDSGFVLDGLVDWIARTAGPEQKVGQFFDHIQFSGKKPSDVFGLVDLAGRRLDLIIRAR